jgi:hypothetical protein
VTAYRARAIMMTHPLVLYLTKHLKSRFEKKKHPTLTSSSQYYHTTSYLLRDHQIAPPRHIFTQPNTFTNDVSRSVPGPLDGCADRLRHPRRIRQRHERRQPLGRLPLRRVLCPRPSQARRPDPLQGLWSPCAVQGADEAVSLSFLEFLIVVPVLTFLPFS